MNTHTTTTPLLKIMRTRFILLVAAVLLAVLVPLSIFNPASADSFDDRIRAIESEIGSFQHEAARLASEAASLQQVIASLTAQKNTIQAQVDLSQARYEKLLADIEANEKKLASTQQVLSTTISDMAAESQTSPIEVLAGSSSVGDFVARQEFRDSVQSQIQESIEQIKKIKSELAKQKVDVERVLAEQKSQRDALAAKEAEQAELLAQTQGQEAAYQNLIGQRRSDLASVQAEQQAAYAAARASWGGGYVTVGGGGGGYPYASAPYPCWTWGCADPWGLFYRECVSYVAWKLDSVGYGVRNFGGAGYAAQWPSTTRGYTSQSGSPSKGAAAVDPYIGVYEPEIGMRTGHVMYVEEVYSNGNILISEYNFAGPGQYSERTIAPSQYSGWTFIQFPGR